MRHQPQSTVKWIFRIGAVFVILGILIAGVIAWTLRSLPDVSVLRNSYVSVKYQGPDEPQQVSITPRRPAHWVSLSQVSKKAIGAVVVSEDWAFYQHSGFDWNQIKDAAKEDWERGRYVRGASTITQQVARNVFLDRDKNLLRKLKEVWIAIQLEEALTKRRILEIYLNIAEWGQGIFGIEQASRAYFNKAPDELSAREGAFLAMLLPSPKRYSQSFRKHALTPWARSMVKSILEKMQQAQFVTEEEKLEALSQKMPFETGPDAPEGGEGEPEVEKEGAAGSNGDQSAPPEGLPAPREEPEAPVEPAGPPVEI